LEDSILRQNRSTEMYYIARGTICETVYPAEGKSDKKMEERL